MQIDGGTMVELTGEVEGGEYVMEDVQRTDEGTYRCRGVNKAGDSLSEPTVLNVISERFLLSGVFSVSFLCPVVFPVSFLCHVVMPSTFLCRLPVLS